MTPRPETNLLICHGLLAPRTRWRETRGRVLARGPEPTASTARLAARPEGTGVRGARALGPGQRSCTGRLPLTSWPVHIVGAPAADRHAAESRRHPEYPHAPGIAPSGPRPGPAPLGVERYCALI